MTRPGLTFANEITRIENALGVPSGTLSPMRNLGEPDWAFVIRIFACVEAVVSLAVERRIIAGLHSGRVGSLGGFMTHPDQDVMIGLSRHIKKLNFNQLKRLGCDIGALEDKDAKFLSALADIRNLYAHDIFSHSWSVDRAIDSVRGQQNKEDFLRKMGYGVSVDIDHDDEHDWISIGFSIFLVSVSRSILFEESYDLPKLEELLARLD